MSGGGRKRLLVLTTFDIVRMDFHRKGHAGSWIHSQFWDRVLLDEAHRICEQSSQTARAIRSLRGRNRWCVTGTPFKNGVTDLVALSKFLMVPPYCNTTWWRTHSSNPHKIREWRHMFVHMQAKHVLALPPLDSRVQMVTSSPFEQTFALHLSQQHTPAMSPPLLLPQVVVAAAAAAAELRDDEDPCDDDGRPPPHHRQEYELLRIMRLRQTANHPLLLYGSSAIALRLITTAAIDNDSGICDACGSGGGGGGCVKAEACAHWFCGACRVAADATRGTEPWSSSCICCVAANLPVVTRGAPARFWRHSSKTQALAEYLTRVLRPGDGDGDGSKVVLFSQWTTCLDLLAGMLAFLDINYATFDGRVNSLEEREATLCRFKNDPTCEVLLTSLGAGGEGLNLTFANHIILMEPYWNLAAEQQAIDRLYRIGQARVTHVLRLCVDDSIENWVRAIQVNKEIELRRLMFGTTTTATATGAADNDDANAAVAVAVATTKRVAATAVTTTTTTTTTWRECKRPRTHDGGDERTARAASAPTCRRAGGGGTLQGFLYDAAVQIK